MLRTIDADNFLTGSNEAVLREVREFEVWYEKAAKRWGRALFVLRTAVVLSGFLVALLTGLTVGRETNQDGIKIAIIALSTLGTLAATFLTQYRVGEIERLRAAGRIGMQKLRLEVQHKFSELESVERRKFLEHLVGEITRIEIEQNEDFYAHFSSHAKMGGAGH